jgi:8-oxo-dGTP pyrophosphatase MutT (NUDIX family)
LPNDDEPHGYMLSEVVNKMPWTAAFDVKHSHPRRVTVLDNSEGKDTANVVNAAFSAVITTCIEQNLFHVLDGKHSEPFAIVGARYDLPVYIERFATALFGVTTRGAHLVAYRMGEKGMNVWVPRRSAHLYTYPNMLDTTVAGGVKSGVPPFQTIVEEADEEASLPEALIRQKARCRGVISHMNVTGKDFPGEQGLVTPDYVYVYDIELPEDVIPKPHDDEVSNFTLMSAEELQAALLREEFKPDSAAVLIDFLIRHEIITPDNEPDFVEISMRLHRRLPFRTG